MTKLNEDNLPDYDLFVNHGTADNPKTQKIGAAWRHNRGDGLSLVFFAVPINGKAVAFPRKSEEEEPEE